MLQKFFNRKFCSFIIFSFSALILFSCATNSQKSSDKQISGSPSNSKTSSEKSITLLFAGDVMAHNVNYNMKDYDKIWDDVRTDIKTADLAFANIEAPVNPSKEASSFPNFNMPLPYLQATIDAGFDVFSLANNHSFDQFENGIKETILTTQKIHENQKEVYFSGLKKSKDESYSYNLITKNDFKILFLPVTEILNYPHNPEYINYVSSREKGRTAFIEFCKNLKEETKPDIFILSIHADEPEYIRTVTKSQRKYYENLCNAGVDVVWANHAHLIKDRIIVKDVSHQNISKVIMCANGNTISGQRRNPDFLNARPDEERDNTGDGIFYTLTFAKNKDSPMYIKNTKITYITTYINTAWEFVIKKMDDNFVNYLYDIKRNNWAEYIKKRIKINNEETKDYEICQ